MVISFGKNKGLELEKLESSYLAWLAIYLDDGTDEKFALKKEAKGLLENRHDGAAAFEKVMAARREEARIAEAREPMRSTKGCATVFHQLSDIPPWDESLGDFHFLCKPDSDRYFNKYGQLLPWK